MFLDDCVQNVKVKTLTFKCSRKEGNRGSDPARSGIPAARSRYGVAELLQVHSLHKIFDRSKTKAPTTDARIDPIFIKLARTSTVGRMSLP